MTEIVKAFCGAQIHDGAFLVAERALAQMAAGGFRIMDREALPQDCQIEDLRGGVLTPGFVDLQVNGGGGVMFNDDPSLETLRVMAAAHRGLGTAGMLPTLITDTPAQTRAAIEAVARAIAAGVAGIVGLHLEGPHLSQARKGAHDGALIRRMEEADLALLCEAAGRLPNLMVTVAPENVTQAQISAMAQAGVIVSLGHTDADFETCMAAFEAGATCVTHLFNAMSQLGSRAPGLVGAALARGDIHAGLIADGVHVHPATMRAALAAKHAPQKVFLVSDAMATAGSEITEFTLNHRQVLRRAGRLTLADGTLAGADLDLVRALEVMTKDVGEDTSRAIARATGGPAGLLRDARGLGGFAHAPDIALYFKEGFGTRPLVLEGV